MPDLEIEDPSEEELSDLEEEEEMEEEEEEEVLEVKNRPPPRRPPPRREKDRDRYRTNRRETPSEVIRGNRREDLVDFLSALDFGRNEYKVRLERLSPRDIPTTGEKCSGTLRTYVTAPDIDEIQNIYGGGTFKFVVHGPHPSTGKYGILPGGVKTFEIAGPPKMPRDPSREAAAERERENELVKALERAEERRDRERSELQKEIRDQSTTIMQMMAKMSENKRDPFTSEMLTTMREEARLREERHERERQEERRREEARREREEREREDRQRAEEAQRQAEERRWREEMAARQRAEEERREREQREREERRREEQQRWEREMEMRKHEREMEIQERRIELERQQRIEDREREQRREEAKLQQQFFTVMNQKDEESRKREMDLFKQMMLQMNKGSDFMKEFEKLMMLKDMIDGKDDRSLPERVIDQLSEKAPIIMGGLSAFNPRGQQQAGGQGEPQRMLPGTIQVVEGVDRDMPQEEQPQLAPPEHTGPPPEQVPGYTPPPGEEEEEAADELRAEDAEPSIPNPLEEFPESYPEDRGQEAIFTLIIQAFDLAVQQNLEADEIYEKVMAPLSQGYKMVIASFEMDDLVQFIQSKVPESWAIASLDGDVKIREVHSLLKEKVAG